MAIELFCQAVDDKKGEQQDSAGQDQAVQVDLVIEQKGDCQQGPRNGQGQQDPAVLLRIPHAQVVCGRIDLIRFSEVRPADVSFDMRQRFPALFFFPEKFLSPVHSLPHSRV